MRRFTDVCDAIDYAHARGVLHRDIKPGNIIVGKYGETLVVDWGLAKATGRAGSGAVTVERTLVPSSASGSAQTLPGSALGTPAYMSPEQAEGDIAHLGPRSDVYSLGATLYFVLTGKPPVEGDVGEVVRAVQRGEFPPPRRHVASIDPALEAVCLKAMAHRPADRHASPRALSEDIERWMADEPVSAWREPLSRRVRRWASRNRTPVAAAAVALVTGVIGLSAVLAVQTSAKAEVTQALGRELAANRALADANDELGRSKAAVQARYELAVEAIQAFHTGVSQDFFLKQDQFRELRDRLLKSAQDFYGRLSALLGRETGPASRRALLASNFELARLTGMVGSVDDSLKSHRDVLAAREALAAEPEAGADVAVDVARSLVAVAGLLGATGKSGESEAMYRRSESLLTGPAGTDPAARAALAECRSHLGQVLSRTGRSAEALATYRLALADQEALAVPGAPAAVRRPLADTINRIGVLLWQTGKPSEAEVEYRRALEIQEKLAAEHPAATDFRNGLARSHNDLAILLSETGKATEAEAEYRLAMTSYKKLAADFPSVTDFRSLVGLGHRNLGHLLSRTGRPRDAEAEYRGALEIQEKLATDHPAVTRFKHLEAVIRLDLGTALLRTGKPKDAEAEFRRASAIQEKLAADNPSVTDFRGDLALGYQFIGNLLRDTGKTTDAETEYRKALNIQEKLVADNPTITDFQIRLTDTYNRLGTLFWGSGRRAQAEAEYRRALVIQEKLAADNPSVTDFRSVLALSHNNLGIILVETDRLADAEVEYRRALEIQEKLAADNPSVADFRDRLGISRHNRGILLSEDKPKAAEFEFRRAMEINRKLASDNPTFIDYRNRLALNHLGLGDLFAVSARPKDAEAEYRLAIESYQKLAADHPANTDYRRRLAIGHHSLGSLLLDSSQLAEAEAEIRAALALYRKLADEDPSAPRPRDTMANMDDSLSVVLRRLRRSAEARDHAGRAVAARETLVRENPSTTTYRAGLAASLRNRGLALCALGDITGACADLRRAMELFDGLPSPSRENRFLLASSHAALSGLAGRPGSGISAAEAVTEAEAAMAGLRKAVAMGYRQLDSFRTEDSLNPLRSRDDFKLLMMDLAMPAAPFAAEAPFANSN